MSLPIQPKPIDVDALRVAKPCPMRWSEMTGDDRVRECSHCAREVYDLSAMTRDEVTALAERARVDRVCVRMFVREDGKVMTADCPVGLAAARRRLAGIAAGIMAAVLSGVGLLVGRGDEESPRPWWADPHTQTVTFDPIVGQMVVGRVVVGDLDPDWRPPSTVELSAESGGDGPEGDRPEGEAPEGEAPEGEAPEGEATEGEAPAGGKIDPAVKRDGLPGGGNTRRSAQEAAGASR